MMKEFCMDTDVGELNPLSSPDDPVVAPPTLVIVAPNFFVGDLPSAEPEFGDC